MYKIEQQVIDGELTDKYTLRAFQYSPSTHTNLEVYSVTNLSRSDLLTYLQGSGPDFDQDFTTVVLKKNGTPVILTGTGELRPTPVYSKARGH